MSLKNEKGQSLVEVLIGLAMSILIVGALINAVTSSLRNSEASKVSAQATKFAQEGIEFIRSERDRSIDWDAFKEKIGTWCLKTTEWPALAGACGSDDFITATIFKRESLIETYRDEDGNVVESRVNVTVTVTWMDQAGEHKSQLSTIFSDTSKWK